MKQPEIKKICMECHSEFTAGTILAQRCEVCRVIRHRQKTKEYRARLAKKQKEEDALLSVYNPTDGIPWKPTLTI